MRWWHRLRCWLGFHVPAAIDYFEHTEAYAHCAHCECRLWRDNRTGEWSPVER